MKYLAICDQNHEAVCYVENYCPACAILDRLKDLEDTIDILEETIQKLENTQE